MPIGNTEQRLTKLETKFDNHEKAMDLLIGFANSIDSKLDSINLILAEQRGAGKFGKVMAHAATSLMGGFAALMGTNIIHK